MDVRHATPARQQCAHVATRLRAVQLAERPRHFGNRQILMRVGGDDEE
jgi:hypothetical protein